MVEFALKVTIVIFITEIIIAPVKIFTEAAASVASTVATAQKSLNILYNCKPADTTILLTVLIGLLLWRFFQTGAGPFQSLSQKNL